MVQFCCGTGDCTAAGATNRSSGSSGGLYPKYANGTIIPPAQEGPMLLDIPKERRSKRPSSSSPRDTKCTADSWIADDGTDDHTRPSDSSMVVATGATPGVGRTITHERPTSYTQTLAASLGFKDMLSPGVSSSSSPTEGTSESDDI
nr:hypothetical protein CFP56_04399 [Quercus suber]